MSSADPSDPRLDALLCFVDDALARQGLQRQGDPEPLPTDASTRRFLRLRLVDGARTLIAMDAPPETENNAQFLRLSPWFRAAGLPVPEIIAADAEAGLILVEDLGDAVLAQTVVDAPEARIDGLYRRAIDRLVAVQVHAREQRPPVPDYSRAILLEETGRFRRWFLEGLLELEPEQAQAVGFDDLAERLADVALAGPRTCVHLDYHCRNLLVQPDDGIAAVDFQDARWGHPVYDLVSLLRDCYLRWPDARVDAWIDHYLDRAAAAGLPVATAADFRRSFDLCGLQRHLKAIGIFCRQHLERGRDRYLGDIPRVLGYVLEVGPRHPETAGFSAWLEAEALTRWETLQRTRETP